MNALYAWLFPLFLTTDPTTGSSHRTSEGFELNAFLESILKHSEKIFGWVVLIIGVLMIFVGIWQIAKGFISGGKGQTNWLMAIGCLLIGGLLLASGIGGIIGLAKGASQTISDLGETGGTILPFWPF